jgi:hypothetical protein
MRAWLRRLHERFLCSRGRHDWRSRVLGTIPGARYSFLDGTVAVVNARTMYESRCARCGYVWVGAQLGPVAGA